MSADDGLMDQARRALREGRPDDAQAVLVNIVARAPENDEAWMLLADTLSDPENKLDCLEHARRLNPHNSAVLRALAEAKSASPAPQPVAETPLQSDSITNPSPNAARMVEPLLEYGQAIAQSVVMTTEPMDTRSIGSQLIRILDQAYLYDELVTRRWARTAGRNALLKYEKALTALITSLPFSDPQLQSLREQRRLALDWFK